MSEKIGRGTSGLKRKLIYTRNWVLIENELYYFAKIRLKQQKDF
jgi:hypothetical protein